MKDRRNVSEMGAFGVRGLGFGVRVTAPLLHVRSVIPGRAVIVLRDPDALTRRALPDDAENAVILLHVGEHPSPDRAGWTFAATTGRSTATVPLPAAILPLTRIWLTAAWTNRRGERGPFAQPAAIRAIEGLATEALRSRRAA